MSQNKGHCHTYMLANKKIARDIELKRKIKNTSKINFNKDNRRVTD